MPYATLNEQKEQPLNQEKIQPSEQEGRIRELEEQVKELNDSQQNIISSIQDKIARLTVAKQNQSLISLNLLAQQIGSNNVTIMKSIKNVDQWLQNRDSNKYSMSQAQFDFFEKRVLEVTHADLIKFSKFTDQIKVELDRLGEIIRLEHEEIQ